MLSQREERATPRADEPARAGAVERPCRPRLTIGVRRDLLAPCARPAATATSASQRLPLHPPIPADESNKGAVRTATHDMQGPT